MQALRDAGVDSSILHHESEATTTFENACLTAPLLQRWDCQTVVIVTNWFHGYRAKLVFNSSGANASDSKPTRYLVYTDRWPSGVIDPGQQSLLRRERYAVLFYMVRYGIWPL